MAGPSAATSPSLPSPPPTPPPSSPGGLAALPEAVRVLLMLLLVLLGGTVLSFIWPTGGHLPPGYARASAIMGHSYFLAWTSSFFPQVYTNWRDRSVVGLSLDFVSLNLLGFSSYALFNCAMFWDAGIKAAYREQHNTSTPGVEVSDVLFSLCGACMTLIMALQCCFYERGDQVMSWACCVFVAAALATGAAYTVLVGLLHRSVGKPFTWLYLLYYFSMIKLSVTPLKYIPQVILNCRRCSTMGWNILNVLLDLTGGLLSLAQVLLTGFVLSDWTVVSGNLVRFGLAVISLVFDGIFMVQHYVLFPDSGRGVQEIALVPYKRVSAKEGDEEDDEQHLLDGQTLSCLGKAKGMREM